MKPMGAFAVPAWWMAGAHLGRVTSVDDPQGLSRVKLTLISEDADGAAEIWARVAVGFAADNCGAFLIPDVGEEVVVVFVGNDASTPIVVGSLWSGATSVPERIGGDRIDRWTITGKAGTRIAIVEAESGQEKIEIETPGGAKMTVTDANGQSITLEAAGNTVTLDTSGVTIDAVGTCSIAASELKVSAGTVTVDSGFSKFSGVVQVDTLIANTVVSTTYTPGAGNIW
jgi:uncharacterized protein involved in type VI secretion and phage assembly